MIKPWLLSIIPLAFSLVLSSCEKSEPSTSTVDNQALASVKTEPVAMAKSEMSNQEKLAVARDMLDAWTALDWERVYELFGEDGVLANMMIEPTVGEAAIRERLKPFESGLTRMDFVVLRMGVIGDDVIVERLDSFDFNGKTGLFPVVGVMDIKAGKVKEWREYYDRNWLLVEMGVVDGDPAHTVAAEKSLASADMSDQQKLAIAQAMLNAYETLDWEKAASLIADDGVIHYVSKNPMRGPDAMRQHLQKVGPHLTRVAFKIRNMGVIDGAVMLERVDEFDYNGNRAAVPVFGSMEIAEGKIKVWREYYDHNQMHRGMGLIE